MVHVDMVLVAVVALSVLLGPPGIRIFLAELGWVIHPALRCLTGFNLCVLRFLIYLKNICPCDNYTANCLDVMCYIEPERVGFRINYEIIQALGK